MVIENISHIFTSIGVVVAIIALIYQISNKKKTDQLSIFINLLNYYDNICIKRQDVFNKIKTEVTSNPKTKLEIHDKQHLLGYLRLRIEQTEPLYAIEHNLLRLEIESMNFINYLCSFYGKSREIDSLIKLKILREISYYKEYLNDLMQIYNNEKMIFVLPIPETNEIKLFELPEDLLIGK